jgi:hypothetical protein
MVTRTLTISGLLPLKVDIDGVITSANYSAGVNDAVTLDRRVEVTLANEVLNSLAVSRTGIMTFVTSDKGPSNGTITGLRIPVSRESVIRLFTLSDSVFYVNFVIESPS